MQWSLYKEKGFIYIDVLIALVVLSVAIIAILYTYNTSLNVNKENDDLKTAVVLANNQLNFLKKYDGSLKDRENTALLSKNEKIANVSVENHKIILAC